jgi:hypothetical protein
MLFGSPWFKVFRGNKSLVTPDFRHIKKNPEEFRELLVNHEGTETIVTISLPGVEEHWEAEIHAFNNLVQAHLST